MNNNMCNHTKCVYAKKCTKYNKKFCTNIESYNGIEYHCGLLWITRKKLILKEKPFIIDNYFSQQYN